jgi:hypothetical protein
MGDRRIPPEMRRALVPRNQSRAVIQPPRRSQGGTDAIKAVSRHCGRAAAAMGLVAFACVAAVYARLMAGPVSFSFLVPTLERQLNSQLQGYSLRVGDAILRLSSRWGLEFRLADVRLASSSNEEIAKAPFAAIDISEPSLLRLSLAASKISLLGPKLLIFNLPGKGLTLTASPDPGDAGAPAPSPAAGGRPIAGGPYADLAAKERTRQAAALKPSLQADLQKQPAALPFNPAPLLSRLFSALEGRGGASSALHTIGVEDAVVYFASEKGVSAWHVADFHIDLDEDRGESALRGELTLKNEDMAWHASFRAVNVPQSKRYSVTASIQDIVPRSIWRSFPALEPLKLVALPVSGQARFDISHEGQLLGADGEVKLGGGEFFAPFDEKHPASIDSGVLKFSYDKDREVLSVNPFELRWDNSVLTLTGAVAHRKDPATNQEVWYAELDGKGTKLSAPQFGAPAVALDALKLSALYNAGTDTVTLRDFTIRGAGGEITVNGQASAVSAGGAITINGTASPMPISFVKVIWPAFIANGGRDWIGSNIPEGRITGGSFSVNLTANTLAALDKDGDLPDSAASAQVSLSGLQIYHIKGLPPIATKETSVHLKGRHFVFDIPGEARIDVPSGRTISFSDASLVIDDLRPRFPPAEIHFKGTGEVGAVLELLDQPPLGYVRAVGFKPSLVNGQVATTFKIAFPLLKDLKFKHMTLGGKSRVSEIKSNQLPGGISVNGGAVNFDVSETAISANGDLKVNNVPVSLMWQRIFDAPPERQPTLRVAAVLNDKAREELGLNVNHIVKGDLPVALAVAMQRDGPPKLFMEANLTGTDLYLTAIGWRKPPGQKATVTLDLSQRADNFLVCDNFAMTGDGQLNINGRLVFNDRRRIASFDFPEFSTNALTKLTLTGELSPQNILKVQAKGPSYDGRQFFHSLLLAGKLAENQPAPLKDEPGLDLRVEIDTVFGYYDTTIKSVSVEARRRGGKLSYLEANGRLNGEAPIAVHVEQRPGQPRVLTSDATDAGSAFRLTGFYSAVRGGTMNLRVNLDGRGAAEKEGTLDVQRFQIVPDQVVGRVISQADREGARRKPDARNASPQASSGEPLTFDRMRVPFSVGSNRFFLHDAAINGPMLGATMKGQIDFGRDTLFLSGTYVPLYGVNSMLGAVPLIGDILNGPNKEGMFGITFAVQGRTSNPDVAVNPMSILAPGILRQAFEYQSAPVQMR